MWVQRGHLLSERQQLQEDLSEQRAAAAAEAEVAEAVLAATAMAAEVKWRDAANVRVQAAERELSGLLRSLQVATLPRPHAALSFTASGPAAHPSASRTLCSG